MISKKEIGTIAIALAIIFVFGFVMLNSVSKTDSVDGITGHAVAAGANCYSLGDLISSIEEGNVRPGDKFESFGGLPAKVRATPVHPPATYDRQDYLRFLEEMYSDNPALVQQIKTYAAEMSDQELEQTVKAIVYLDDVSGGRALDILSSPRGTARESALTEICLATPGCRQGFEGVAFFVPAGSVGVKEEGTVVIKVLKSDGRGATIPQQAKVFDELNALGYGPRIHSYSNDFYVVDEVQGPTLKEHLSSLSPEDRIREAPILEQQYKEMADQLSRRGILINDLHSDNIILDKEGKLKLIDVGYGEINPQVRVFPDDPSRLYTRSLTKEEIQTFYDKAGDKLFDPLNPVYFGG